jgi:hypothetical protein
LSAVREYPWTKRLNKLDDINYSDYAAISPKQKLLRTLLFACKPSRFI